MLRRSDFKNNKLVHSKNPFAKHDDMTGPYAVYDTLYEAVKQGLTEEDPTTTDWEGCKAQINEGNIGCMVLGSWAVPQMQAGGPNADDIAYMPFPSAWTESSMRPQALTIATASM
ncbi:MAG: hypothetical protein ACLT3Y_01450 [Ruminococcus callidus]